MKVRNGRMVTSFVPISDWQDNGKGCREGGAGKVELTTQVIFHAVQDNHGVVEAGGAAKTYLHGDQGQNNSKEGGNSVSKTLTPAWNILI